jgi:DNA-binding transcriptional ArsR family regulator
MVKYKSPRLDEVFSALADPTRRAILTRLARGEASVSDLAEPFAMSLPAVSKHLKILEAAGLLTRSKDGRVHRLQLKARPMKKVFQWTQAYGRFWAPEAEGDYLFNESFEVF